MKKLDNHAMPRSENCFILSCGDAKRSICRRHYHGDDNQKELLTVRKNLLTVRKKLPIVRKIGHVHNLRKGYTDFLTVSNFFLTISNFLWTVSNFLLSVSKSFLTRRKPCRLVRINQFSFISRNTNNWENDSCVRDDGNKLNG